MFSLTYKDLIFTAVLAILVMAALLVFKQASIVPMDPPDSWLVSDVQSGVWLGESPYAGSRISSKAIIDPDNPEALGEAGTWIAYVGRGGDDVVVVSSIDGHPGVEYIEERVQSCVDGACSEDHRDELIETPLGLGVIDAPEGAWTVFIPRESNLVVVGSVGGPDPSVILPELRDEENWNN